MKVLVTDLTEMHQGNYCVAGWSASAGKMVRPLPNGSNWTVTLLASAKVMPGATLDVVPTGTKPSSVFPHLTEDLFIDASKITYVGTWNGPWIGTGAPPVAGSLAAAFAGTIQTTGVWNGAKKAAYVPETTKVGSLSALAIAAGRLVFFEDDYNGKKSLRAYLEDGADKYSLPVVAKNLREVYRAKGADAVNQMLPKGKALHVRVGLARAWSGQPGRCTVMINGVYW